MKIMKIEDQRQDTLWVPAKSILEEFIPKFDQKYFIGIKKIVLIDEDYHSNNILDKAYGRYIQIQGTKFAEIELYFNHFLDLPDEAKQSKFYITYNILSTLVHELYHHRIRGQKKLRKPKFNQEQSDADKWAQQVLSSIITEKFPKDKFEKEWNEVQKKIKEHRWNIIQEKKNKLNIDEVEIENAKKKIPAKIDMKNLKKLLKSAK